MIQSMTGFAAAKGQLGAYAWSWDLRSVNAKGLDVRLRVPDWIPGLETALRARLGKALARGSVSLGLRVSRAEDEGAMQVNQAQLSLLLEAIGQIEAAAAKAGVTLAPTSAADLLAQRGILEQSSSDEDLPALLAALTEAFEPLLADLLTMRQAEGRALGAVLTGQIDQIEALTLEAAKLGQARSENATRALREALARVTENAVGVDPDRVAQEMAMIAIKSDVTEEIDRLHAHIAAARELLVQDGPFGRKLDFLTQEFNREANTLCSKAQFAELTRVGLDLKTVIDQLREQVQNVE